MACILPTNWWIITSRLSAHTTRDKHGPCCQLLPLMWLETTFTAFWWVWAFGQEWMNALVHAKWSLWHTSFINIFNLISGAPDVLWFRAMFEQGQVPASASTYLFSLLNGWGDAWLEMSYYLSASVYHRVQFWGTRLSINLCDFNLILVVTLD